jgi:hypothetical protein
MPVSKSPQDEIIMDDNTLTLFVSLTCWKSSSLSSLFSSSPLSSSSSSSSSPYAPPAAFLREELAIRLSHRVRDLQELPDGLSEMENVKLVRGWYAESFDELVK